MTIKFGTDGWRATIAQEYTFDNLKIVAAALAAHLQKTEKDKLQNGVAIGYDTRFLSAEFAQTAAEVLSAAGIPTKVSDRDATTPAIAWAARGGELAAGWGVAGVHDKRLRIAVRLGITLHRLGPVVGAVEVERRVFGPEPPDDVDGLRQHLLPDRDRRVCGDGARRSKMQ